MRMERVQENLLRMFKIQREWNNKGMGAKAVVPHLSGGPGIGKSAIVEAAAKELGAVYFDGFKGSHIVGEDIKMGCFDHDKKTVVWYVGALLRDAQTVAQAGKLVLFNYDEITAMTRHDQKVSLQTVGEHKLPNGEPFHANVLLCATGNRVQDNADSFDLISPLQGRLVTIEVVPTAKHFLSIANKFQVNPLIQGYIAWKGDHALWNPDMAGPNPCPRTWVGVSMLMTGFSNQKFGDDPDFIELSSGLIGAGPTVDFACYIEHAEKCDSCTIEHILKDPVNCVIPGNELGLKWALAMMAAGAANKSNIDKIAKFLPRCGRDIEVIAWPVAIAQDKDIVNTAAFSKAALRPEIRPFLTGI
jgi:hypothetical protein